MAELGPKNTRRRASSAGNGRRPDGGVSTSAPPLPLPPSASSTPPRRSSGVCGGAAADAAWGARPQACARERCRTERGAQCQCGARSTPGAGGAQAFPSGAGGKDGVAMTSAFRLLANSGGRSVGMAVGRSVGRPGQCNVRSSGRSGAVVRRDGLNRTLYRSVGGHLQFLGETPKLWECRNFRARGSPKGSRGEIRLPSARRLRRAISKGPPVGDSPKRSAPQSLGPAMRSPVSGAHGPWTSRSLLCGIASQSVGVSGCLKCGPAHASCRARCCAKCGARAAPWASRWASPEQRPSAHWRRRNFDQLDKTRGPMSTQH